MNISSTAWLRSKTQLSGYLTKVCYTCMWFLVFQHLLTFHHWLGKTPQKAKGQNWIDHVLPWIKFFFSLFIAKTISFCLIVQFNSLIVQCNRLIVQCNSIFDGIILSRGYPSQDGKMTKIPGGSEKWQAAFGMEIPGGGECKEKLPSVGGGVNTWMPI